LIESPEPDVPKLHTQFLALMERFRNLTNRAQAFMRDLQSTIQLHGVSVAQFLVINGASIIDPQFAWAWAKTMSTASKSVKSLD